MEITSKQNALIKKLNSLKQKKFRREYGLYMIEGIKMVDEAIANDQPIEYIVVTAVMANKAIYKPYNVIETTDEIFDTLSDQVAPQGVLAVLRVPQHKEKNLPGTSLILDGIKDAGNLGTIIRTAAASGVKNIVLIDCVDPYNSKTLRASMSGIFFVNLFDCKEDEALKLLEGKFVIVADMDGENVFEYSIDHDFCLIVGSEAQGVSDKLRRRADITLSIPMQSYSESLNAGVSCGIILYRLLN